MSRAAIVADVLTVRGPSTNAAEEPLARSQRPAEEEHCFGEVTAEVRHARAATGKRARCIAGQAPAVQLREHAKGGHVGSGAGDEEGDGGPAGQSLVDRQGRYGGRARGADVDRYADERCQGHLKYGWDTRDGPVGEHGFCQGCDDQAHGDPGHGVVKDLDETKAQTRPDSGAQWTLIGWPGGLTLCHRGRFGAPANDQRDE